MGLIKVGKYSMDPTPVSEGNTSKVFVGTDDETGAKVAIKRMRDVPYSQQEAGFMHSCPPHPHLVKLHGFFISDPYGYLVMEYHPGERLGYYKHGRKRDARTAVQITVRTLQGLHALHESGLLHCDITPHNIMTVNDDPETVKIVDFGTAVRIRKAGEYVGPHKGGTHGYAPPELTWGFARVDDSSDVYSAACVCIYLLIGEAPYSPKHACRLIEDEKLRSVLTKATSSDRRERYRTARRLIEALAPFC